MTIQFFLPMVPPTVTHQEKQVTVVNGRPRFYEPAELKAARVKLRDAIARHCPPEPMQGGVGLHVKWCFPRGNTRMAATGSQSQIRIICRSS